jgi:hypothetical protein
MIELILDKCLDDIRARRANVAECLARYPDFSDQLAPLLEVALALEQTKKLKPSNDFKEATRARFARMGGPSPRPHKRLGFLMPRRAA